MANDPKKTAEALLLKSAVAYSTAAVRYASAVCQMQRSVRKLERSERELAKAVAKAENDVTRTLLGRMHVAVKGRLADLRQRGLA